MRLRRIGLEVRHKNPLLAEGLLSESVADAKTPEGRGFYAWRYARFAARVLGDADKASDIMISAISQDKVSRSPRVCAVCYCALPLATPIRASGHTHPCIWPHPQGNLVLYLQLLDLELSRVPPSEERGERVFRLACEDESLSEEGKQSMAFRQMQFLEEYSSDIDK